jgi:putative copper resistance protein D
VYGIADLIRGLHLAASLLPAGGYIFLAFVAVPAGRGFVADGGAQAAVASWVNRLLPWNLAAAFVTGGLWLCAEAVEMSGQPLHAAMSSVVLGTVLTGTTFGRLWLVRLALLVLLATLLADRRRFVVDPRLRLWTGLVVSAAFAGTLAWAGHAAAGAGAEGVALLTTQIVHLLASAGWLGALPPLVYLLAKARREPATAAFATVATQRFSTLGLVCVAGLLASGSVNAWFLVGTVPALLGTAYGHLLLVKLALFGAMLSLAAINRFRLTPALGFDRPYAINALWRNAALETVLGLGVLLIVGALGATAPGIHDQPTWPLPFAFSAAALEADPTLRLVLTFAGVLAAFSVAAAVYGFRVKRRATLWIGIGGVVISVIASGQFFLVWAYPTSFMRSPVGYTADAIAHGARLYQKNCVICHGEGGRGDGPAAASLAIKPANLTEPHLFHHGEGTLFWWIGNGVSGSPMPGFAEQIDPTGRWQLIQFLRAQAEAAEGGSLNAAAEPPSEMVAPDFAFQIGHGKQETLKALRGKAIVYLVLYSLPESLDRLRQIAAASADLGKSGVRIIALPIGESPEAAALPSAASILAAQDASAVDAYLLYRPAADHAAPAATHMEFLIDRAGYIRARWSLGASNGWGELSRLKEEIEHLMNEPPRPSAPEGHVHG